MILVPWILTALRGTLVLTVVTFVIKAVFGSDAMSWHILWFGVPTHVLADFTGFCDVIYDSGRKLEVVGPCYIGLVVLAIVSGFVVGAWAWLVLLLEAVLLGVPGGHHHARRELARV
jgi:hypothetical protein